MVNNASAAELWGLRVAREVGLSKIIVDVILCMPYQFLSV